MFSSGLALSKLLYPYIRKLGKVKFWAIMVAPMIYYLINFPLFVLGFFNPSENVDAMTNIIIFNFASIFTGIVFGVAFLSVAKTLKKDSDLRNHMIIAWLWGFTSLLYCWLCYCFTGSVSSIWTCFYILCRIIVLSDIFRALFLSSYGISRYRLRNSIRKSVTEQSKLLDSIGTAQMEQELESRVLTITKRLSDKMEEETGVEASMTVEDMKEQIEMVRKEVHK